jgi:nicotinamidase-related amidase
MTISPNAALLVIDLQCALDHPSWGTRNNSQAEVTGLRVLDAWRASCRAVFHIRHDSTEPGSTYRPGQPGHDFKPGFEPLPSEFVIAKTVNSAFIGTDLEARLRAAGHNQLVIFGAITNNCIEATVRMSGNMGFDTFLVEDACFTFGRRDWQGVERTAEEIHAMSLANLDGEYCRVVTAEEVLAATMIAIG